MRDGPPTVDLDALDPADSPDSGEAGRDAPVDVDPARPEADPSCIVFADYPTVSLFTSDGAAIYSVRVVEGPCVSNDSFSLVSFEYWLDDEYKCRHTTWVTCKVEVTTASGPGRATVHFGIGGIPSTWTGIPPMVEVQPISDGGVDAH
jgi:hypothetical protein